jgi:hypothetical protein
MGTFSLEESNVFCCACVATREKRGHSLKVQLSFSALNLSPEAHMAVSLKFPAAALALLIAGCSSLPTETDASLDSASAAQNTAEAAADSSSSRTGNLFGSGT